ncbi:hypothetical protein [Flavobacterium sp. GSB-24]|uniref:hypothetical protein n=1 Tax=Flavobacterium sp. GSB-24 TaxID=2994319 RepID=UPI0024901A1D|nr:hypothetical protein [Flavobacterium sp. GSB-24]BDU27224.1 hypothetical protein FLGSB24_39680 [Flavobacterium sp. GSB-24]
MKKITQLIAITFLILHSCSGDDNSIPVVKDVIESPFNVKYEVAFSSGLKEKRNFTVIEYASENSDKKFAINNRTTISDLSKTWTHNFTYTGAKKPTYLVVNTNIEPVSEGSVRFKIYVNNKLVEDKTITVNPRTDILVEKFFGASHWVNKE